MSSDPAAARQQVEADEVAAAVIIPAGFTDGVIPKLNSGTSAVSVALEVYAQPQPAHKRRRHAEHRHALSQPGGGGPGDHRSDHCPTAGERAFVAATPSAAAVPSRSGC